MSEERGPLSILAVYPSKSKPDLEYTVTLGSDDNIYCDCPAWRFQKGIPPQARVCKHTRAYRQEHGLPEHGL